MRSVEVRKYKWPDRFIDRGMETVLGEDPFGRWHAMPAGRPIEGADGAVWRVHHAAVCLYPREGWFCAVFTPGVPFSISREQGGDLERWHIDPREVYVHISTPPAMRDGALCWTDLELDVIRNPDGSVVVLDEHEFQEMAYPPDVAEAARAACDEVQDMLRNRIEPFGEVGARWLARFEAGFGQHPS